MKYSREEEHKNEIKEKYFNEFNHKQILGNIDFCIADKNNANIYHLWAEAKPNPTDIYKMFAQLFLTVKPELHKLGIYKHPPKYLGVFDNEKIAFVEFYYAQTVFNLNDFDWTERPSNPSEHSVEQVKNYLKNITVFNIKTQKQNIKDFIKTNFNEATNTAFHYRQIDKNNFTHIYQHWLEAVKPHINADWKALREQTEKPIYERDFFLADLNIEDNNSIEIQNHNIAKQGFHIVFNNLKYEVSVRNKNGLGFIENIQRVGFKRDNLEPYKNFWKNYKRPPKEEYWNFIIDRQDLLVEQDVRERKGTYYTPKQWVELSQKYLAKTFGINWQDEYYIWDCAAGSGNLLNGLLNKERIFASDIDPQNIGVMEELIRNGNSNLLKQNIFQFDFLNDSFSELPKKLQNIIKNEPEKLIIYINPPYVEAGSVFVKDNRKNKKNVATNTKIWEQYKDILGLAIRELSAQFFIRIIKEIPSCKLATFAKLKYMYGKGFISFRECFKAKYLKGFLVPADSFDNVNGQFPISFKIWDTGIDEKIADSKIDVYDKNQNYLGIKKVHYYNDKPRITDWINKINAKDSKEIIGYTGNNGPDFQNNNYLHISSYQKLNTNNTLNNATKYGITANNLIPICIYYAVRKVIKKTWLNDRDQFLYPNGNWKKDKEFQNDCLAYTLFHRSNNIQSQFGTNYWIPFRFDEVESEKNFESSFMTDFIAGKIITETKGNVFGTKKQEQKPLQFSKEAKKVFDCGKELWKYYHSIAKGDVNYINDASFYDIRKYFQGTDEKGEMNTKKSDDKKYTLLLNNLSESMKILGEKIVPKVYEYGFLLE